MTLVPTNADRKKSAAAPRTKAAVRLVGEGKQPAHLTVFSISGQAMATLAAQAHIKSSAITGTIDSGASSPIDRFYGYSADVLISGEPLRASLFRNSEQLSPQVARLRTSDLVAELRDISGQVNRMMCQVERAIDRLGVYAS
jgi:hypothetical protein